MNITGKHETRLARIACDAAPAGVLATVVGGGAMLLGLADPIGYALLTLVAGLATSPMLVPAKPQPVPVRIRARRRQ